ncbi:MAG: hypothetical protein GOU98_01165 [Candidatus Altiarchaeota archaeon]|nr:hypothetical protein [Candidatus Altiarchaeota archaeon]
MKKSPWVYMLSQGTCNGCELEELTLFSPRFDVERFGIKRVASPRHADIVLLTGCGTKKLSEKAQQVLDQVPEPRVLIEIGACALNGGIFKCPGPRIKGDIKVQGCPPRPTKIIEAIKEGGKLLVSKGSERTVKEKRDA